MPRAGEKRAFSGELRTVEALKGEPANRRPGTRFTIVSGQSQVLGAGQLAAQGRVVGLLSITCMQIL